MLSRDISIAPGFRVCPGRRGRQHVLDHQRQHALGPIRVVLLHGVLRRAAGIAVRHAGAVLEGRVGVRISGRLQLLVQQMHGVVQEVGVAVADRDVQLALELRPERGPVALEDRRQVVVVVPVGQHFLVDLAGHRIDDLAG